MANAIEFEIKEHYATLSKRGKWTLELNKVSFNGKEPKYDIRNWDENHQNMSKGITLTQGELEKLGEAIKDI